MTKGTNLAAIDRHPLERLLDVIVWEADPASLQLKSVSAGAVPLLGHPTERLLELGWEPLLHPEDRESTLSLWRRAGAGGEGVSTEHRMVTASGRVRWFCARVSRSGGAGGSLWGVMFDVTARHEAEEAHPQEPEERLQRLVGRLPVLLWTVDRDLTITSAAGGGLTAFELRPNEAVGLPLQQYFQREDPELPPLAMHRRVLAGESVSYEYSGVETGGRTYQSYIEPVYDRAGQVIGASGIAIDITDRKRYELRLEAQYEVAQALAESDSLADASPKLLRAICRGLDWDLGELWIPDTESPTIRRVAWWSHGDLPEAELSELEATSSFTEGVGVPGIVWRTAQPLWIPDMSQDTRFVRARAPLPRRMLRGACGVPVVLREGVLGVLLLFFSERSRPPDDTQLRWLEAVGSEIGQFIRRKQSEQAVRESEARKRAILESALDAVITIDHRGVILEANPAVEKIFGYRMEELIGKEMASLIIPPRLRERHRQGLERCARTGEGTFLGARSHLPAYRADGTEFDAEIAITRIGESRPPRFTGYIRDISARTRVEAMVHLLDQASVVLARSLELEGVLADVARLVVPKLADLCLLEIWRAGPNPRQLFVSHVDPAREEELRTSFERWLPDVFPDTAEAWGAELTLHADLAAALQEASPPRATYLSALRLAAAQSAILAPLMVQGRARGILLLASATAGRQYDPAELHVVREIARRIALAIENAQLYRDTREAARVRDEFMSIAAHELRTPLSALILQFGSARRLAAEEGAPRDRLLEKLDKAGEQANRLKRLIESLLDVARLSGGRLVLEPEVMDLSQLASEVVERFAEQAHRAHSRIELRSGEGVRGRWDRLRIEQVLTNLLSNALKYGASEPIEVEVETGQGMAQLSVTDHGIGIAPEQQERIFDRFERAVSVRHYGGLGLGLYIARQIVDAHGGSIRVTSAPGTGSTFIVELPLEPAPNHREVPEWSGEA